MANVTFSFITPTIWRDTLNRTAKSITSQMEEGDEWLLVGNEKEPKMKFPSAKYLQLENEPEDDTKGATKRNLAIQMANASHLWFIDDDDEVTEGSVAKAREVVGRNPFTPHVFRMIHTNGAILWPEKFLRMRRNRWMPEYVGQVGGGMFVPPNDKQLLPRWPIGAGGDNGFIRLCQITFETFPIPNKLIICNVGQPLKYKDEDSVAWE